MTRLLKRGLLVFWALWLSVVCTTNTMDGLKHLGVLGPDWRFASGNGQAIADATARYGAPAWLNGTLFAGVIAWEGLAAILFWRAAWLIGRARGAAARDAAFAASLGLWAAFILADELLIQYPLEAVHFRLFIATLVSLLAIALLPPVE